MDVDTIQIVRRLLTVDYLNCPYFNTLITTKLNFVLIPSPDRSDHSACRINVNNNILIHYTDFSLSAPQSNVKVTFLQLNSILKPSSNWPIIEQQLF